MLLVPNVVLNYYAIKLCFADEHIPFKEKYQRKMIYKFNFLLSKSFLTITTQPCNYFLICTQIPHSQILRNFKQKPTLPKMEYCVM
jgi:hypothetical protein